jgi:putative transcriptional regulator
MAESLTGRLLVAAPQLIDPNFARTVVLVCRHDDEDGALGLILNRPTDIAVGDHLPGWVEVVSRPEVVHLGGPVQPEVAIGLGRCRPGFEPPGWTMVAGRLGMVDLSGSPAEATAALEALRVFAGYAGWSAGQLDFEASSGDWFSVPPGPDDVFPARAEQLWREVLRRQPSELALYADFPPDPSLN